MKHLAMIMDGNRRWAKEKGIAELYGYDSKKSVRLAIEFCIKREIKHLSLYAFSLENFNRSKMEQNLIFKLLSETINNELPELIKQGVRIRFIGDEHFFPDHIKPLIKNAEEKTSHLTVLQLNLLFCYGGQQEVLAATKLIAKRVKEGSLELENIDLDTFENSLWTMGIPAPNLIIRTSGVVRLSNFLTYQAAYSEFAFLDCYWPELTEEKLQGCLDNYNSTKRNFGS